MYFQSSSEFKQQAEQVQAHSYRCFQSSSEFKLLKSLLKRKNHTSFNPLLSLRIEAIHIMAVNSSFQSSSEFKNKKRKQMEKKAT